MSVRSSNPRKKKEGTRASLRASLSPPKFAYLADPSTLTMTAELSLSYDAASVRSAPVHSARPTSALGQHPAPVRRPSSVSLRTTHSLPLSTPTAHARLSRPVLQLATSPATPPGPESPSRRGVSLGRAPGASISLVRTPSLPRRPPSPASSPSTTSTPSPTLYRPPHARLSTSPSSTQNLSWTNTSRSPSPTLSRPRPQQQALLEVHGDSFCGVFTLLGSKCAVKRYSGASARVSSRASSSVLLSIPELTGAARDTHRGSTTRNRRDRCLRDCSTDLKPRALARCFSCSVASTLRSTTSGEERRNTRFTVFYTHVLTCMDSTGSSRRAVQRRSGRMIGSRRSSRITPPSSLLESSPSRASSGCGSTFLEFSRR